MEMATICLATQMSPSEYKALTWRERSAFIEAFVQRNGGGDDR